MKDCLDTGWVSSAGSYVTAFENSVARFTGSRFCVATVNGTSALHLSLQLAGVQPGDGVIVPNITFVASVNAICYTGAHPLLVDIDPHTWQMDLALLADFLARETDIILEQCVLKTNRRVLRAIMPVHVLGNMGDMDRLLQIARQYHLKIVEDASEAMGSFFNGKHAGTFGTFGCFSFNGNKIITTGGGGMICTDDEQLALRARHLTTQAKTDPIEFIHDEIGYNYRLVNVLAAIGVAQMEQLPFFIQQKKAIAAFYRDALCDVAGISFQAVRQNVSCNEWLFTFRTPRQKSVLQRLNEKGYQSRPLWRPMNQLTMFAAERYITRSDVSDAVYNTSVCIPCSTHITQEEQMLIVNCLENM